MSNDLKSNGEHAGGANNDFPKFASGDNADKVLSASYQNKLIAGVERANRKTYGDGVIDFGPMTLSKGKRRAPESGNRIRVRLDYPYRAPMGAVVGVDFPILDEAIEDQYDLVNFLNDPVTTYSCSKNQYRHHNRIAILEQELLPGQTGWAVISGVAKTFWHAQMAPIDNEDSFYTQSAEDMLPYETTDGPRDSYKALGILAAVFNTDTGTATDISPIASYGAEGSEHYYTTEEGDIKWDNRTRPWWLAPCGSNDLIPKPSSALVYPYGGLQESNPDTPSVTNEQITASGRGRVLGLSGVKVPDVSCTGLSTVVCQGLKWSVKSSTCSSACSSWFAIENFDTSSTYGMTLPCAEGAEISNVPCYPDYPIEDNHLVSTAASEGAWNSVSNVAKNWIVGPVVLGTPFERPSEDTEAEYGYDSSQRTREFGVYTIGDLTIPRPDSINEIDYETVLRRCANITCTYKCDGTDWIRERGQSPWILDDFWSCKCPDDWMSTMAGADLPCNATSQPREFTVGMIYDSVNTTTTTTSSTTTTTAATGACCYTLSAPGFGMDCVDGTTLSGCDALSGTWTEGVTCSSIGSSCHLGACCRAVSPSSECSIETEYDCQRNSTGDYEFMGIGTTCEGVSCQGGACCNQDTGGCGYTFQATCDGLGAPWTYLGDGVGCGSCSATTTTSSTTTTTGTTSTTTTSSTTTTTAETTTTTTSSTTTTTAAPTGACCISGVCSITTGADCVSSAGTYQGNGTTCSPDPCESTTTTSSTTTTTAGSSTTTSSTTTTTAQNIGACCYSTSACANVASLEDCINDYSGSYAGDGTTCQDTPNPCGY